MFSKLKAGFQKAGKDMKGGLEKAGHNMKGGLEKAGQNIKKNVEEANRSRHTSPSKKQSELKSHTTTTHDNKSEKPHSTTAAASEHHSEGASASAVATTNITSAQPSHISATRASSAHSDNSSRASLKETASPAAAAAAAAAAVATPQAPRSRAGTPVPPPPPKTPKRAGGQTTSRSAAAAGTVVEVAGPPQHGRTPSEESGNSLHFSEADELETPGSIQFSMEPGSALKKPPPPQRQAAPSPAAAAAPSIRVQEEEEDKADDLTNTESSLDIVVEEEDDGGDDVTSNAAAAAEEVEAPPPPSPPPPPPPEPKKAGKEKKPAAKASIGEKKSESVKETRSAATSRRPSPSTRKEEAAAAVTASAAEEKSGDKKKSTPLRSRSGVKGKAEAAEHSKPITSGRGGNQEVKFADAAAAPSSDDEKQHKRRSKKRSKSRDSKRRDSSGEDDLAAVRRGRPASSRKRSTSDNSSSGTVSAGRNRESESEGEEERPRQRKHHGFRLSPARSDDSREKGAEKEEERQSQRAGKSSRSRRSSRDKVESVSTRDAPRGEHREERGRQPPRRRSSHRRDGDHKDEEREYRVLEADAERHRRRRSASGPPSTPPAPGRRTSLHRHTPVSLMDGGALVEECLRETEDYGRTPVQHRSAVQSTYQQDYPNWSDPREADDEGRGGGSRRYGAQSTSPHRFHGRRSPTGTAPSASSSFHRLSFYDEDDALAAEAVTEPARFRAHSAHREGRGSRHYHGEDFDAGGEEVRPRGRSRSLSSADEHHSRRERRSAEEAWLRRPPQRVHDVEVAASGRRSRDTTPHYAPYYADSRRVISVSPGSARHVYDAPRPRSPPHTSSHRRRSSARSANDEDDGLLRPSSWHRIPEDRTDPDYYYSDAAHERHNSASWNSRSRHSAFGPSPPRSPLWAHRSSFGRAAPRAEAASASLTRLQRLPGGGGGGTPTALSPLRGRGGTGLRAASGLRSPLTSRNLTSGPSPVRSESEILDEVEWKLDALGRQILAEDADRERAMLRSPFERLYHLNNRRDRDERRQKVFQLNRLERIRDRIVSGSLEEDIARREERLKKQEEMLSNPNGVFLRLYQNVSNHRDKTGLSDAEASGEASRHSTPHTSRAADASGVSKGSSRPGSAMRRTMGREQRLAMCDRLYSGAVAEKNKKDAMIKQSAEDRRRREVEELLVARLVAQLQLEHAQLRPKEKKRPLALTELEEEARRKLETLRQEDPTGYEAKLLRGRVLTPREQGLASARLNKQGYVSKESLVAQKAKDELRGCTFQPTVNAYSAFGGGARTKNKLKGGKDDSNGDYDNDSEESGRRDRSSSDDGDDAQQHHSRRTEADRCKELYRKGMKAKAREAELRDEHDREMRLKILRGRMVNDHHFRRRVELDPSLAKRFMKSLVV